MNQSNRRVPGPLTLLGVLVVTPGFADESPMGYFAEQDAINAKKNAPILTATTTDELIKLGAIPERYAESLAAMSPDEIAQFIDSIKQNLDSSKAVAERVEGDRAVVLRESAHPGSWNKIVQMTRTDGAWTPSGEMSMQSDSGATGSFVVSGIAIAESSDVQITQSDGYFNDDGSASVFLTLSDLLGESLSGAKLPTVTFSHSGCLTQGSHSISHPRGGFTTAGASIVDAQSFDENISGTMEVTKIDGDRFWASFEMTAVQSPALGAEPDPAQAVSVTGSISNASNLCKNGGDT